MQQGVYLGWWLEETQEDSHRLETLSLFVMYAARRLPGLVTWSWRDTRGFTPVRDPLFVMCLVTWRDTRGFTPVRNPLFLMCVVTWRDTRASTLVWKPWIVTVVTHKMMYTCLKTCWSEKYGKKRESDQLLGVKRQVSGVFFCQCALWGRTAATEVKVPSWYT